MESKKLKTFLTEPIKNGYSPVCVEKQTGQWVLGLGALQENGFDKTQIKAVTKNNTKIKRFFLKAGDFLVSRSNTLDKVGRVALFRGEIKDCAYPDLMMKFRIDESKLNPGFLELFLKSKETKKYFQRCASGTSGSMVKITKSILENVNIPNIPFVQQQKIAEILQTWDKAIQLTEQLIEKKQRYKKALMNKLLSNSMETAMFQQSRWMNTDLNSLILDIGDGGTPKRNNKSYFGGGIAWAVIDDIKPEIYITKNSLSTQGLRSSSAKLWPINSIIVSTGASIGFVGIAKIPLATKQGITGIIFDTRNVDIKYMYYWFLNNTSLLKKYSQGSSFKEIRPELLKKIELKIPDNLSIQKKIADILSSFDDEITLLNKYLKFLNQTKKALMQTLLTGKIKINFNATENNHVYA